MKKVFLLGFATILFVSCKQEVRYTQQSAEIDTYKKVMEDYKTLNWEDYPKHYADTAKIANNVPKEKAQTVTEALQVNIETAKLFTWVIENEEIEMVVTDKKETWVNYWATWKGTMKATNKVYIIPFHSTAQFIDGKIVKEFGYWDNSEVNVAMEQISVTPTTNAEKVAVEK